MEAKFSRERTRRTLIKLMIHINHERKNITGRNVCMFQITNFLINHNQLQSIYHRQQTASILTNLCQQS